MLGAVLRRTGGYLLAQTIHGREGEKRRNNGVLGIQTVLGVLAVHWPRTHTRNVRLVVHMRPFHRRRDLTPFDGAGNTQLLQTAITQLKQHHAVNVVLQSRGGQRRASDLLVAVDGGMGSWASGDLFGRRRLRTSNQDATCRAVQSTTTL